jgi:alkylation response protein AidB-like acyl-CoA dehydrogenase
VARELDEQARFPWDNVREMADRGWFGINVAQELGGLGRDYLCYILAIEELARVDASHSITVSAHSTLGTSPIVNFGTEEQKRRFVPLLAGGRGAGRLRPHRAGRRLRRGRHPYHGRPRERALPAQRQQDLHYPRRRG